MGYVCILLYVCETQIGGQRGAKPQMGGMPSLDPFWRRHWTFGQDMVFSR